MLQPVYNHYDTPNGENSFYSVQSVIAKVSETLDSEVSLKALEEKLSEYYIPAFTVLLGNTAVIVDVYTRAAGHTATIKLDRVDGSIPEEFSPTKDTIATLSDIDQSLDLIEPSGKLATDGSTQSFKSTVDPSMHADGLIKRPLANGDTLGLPEENVSDGWYETYGYQPMENIFTSKFTASGDDDEIITNAQANLTVMNKIVASQIQALSPELKDQVTSEYLDWVDKL